MSLVALLLFAHLTSTQAIILDAFHTPLLLLDSQHFKFNAHTII